MNPNISWVEAPVPQFAGIHDFVVGSFEDMATKSTIYRYRCKLSTCDYTTEIPVPQEKLRK